MSDDSHFSFDSFSFSQKQLIYRGFLALVNSNSGYGFGGDQGAPAYAIGRNGTVDQNMWGDSPDKNNLFKMMHDLSIQLSDAEIDGSSEIGEYVFSWADFCNLGYGAYEKSKIQG